MPIFKLLPSHQIVNFAFTEISRLRTVRKCNIDKSFIPLAEVILAERIHLKNLIKLPFSFVVDWSAC